jgi:hypothetical protein
MVIGVVWGKPSSPYRFLNHVASHPVSDSVTYSDSVVDSAIIDCFLDFQVIVPPEAKKMYPDMDLPSSWFTKAASENP